MKKQYSIDVKGRRKVWAIKTKARPEWAKEWQDDGLEVNEILYTIPVWVHKLGLTKPWCMLQDLWKMIKLW